MSDNIENSSNEEKKVENQPCCEEGNCCTTDSEKGNKSVVKLIVFILIVLSAGTVLTNSLIKKSRLDQDQTKTGFATIQTKTGANVQSDIKNESQTLWKMDLDSLSSLNKIAGDANAVFIMLSDKNNVNDKNIKKEIEMAAKKIMSDGNKISAFRLKESAPAYKQLVKQYSPPIVLAMVKSRGMSAVSGDITEAKLIKAFVAASRPSSCGSAACGSAGCQ